MRQQARDELLLAVTAAVATAAGAVDSRAATGGLQLQAAAEG
jgi:hypothetical protein